jgi:hypothetical protein
MQLGLSPQLGTRGNRSMSQLPSVSSPRCCRRRTLPPPADHRPGADRDVPQERHRVDDLARVPGQDGHVLGQMRAGRGEQRVEPPCDPLTAAARLAVGAAPGVSGTPAAGPAELG